MISNEFKENILSKFRTDGIGNCCRKDETILLIGSIFYGKMKRKSDKSVEVKKSVRTDMRRLASLYLHFKERSCMEPVFGNSHDMFNRANFTTLSDAIEDFTTTPEKKLKPGLKQNLYYLLLRSAKVLKASLLVQKKDEQASDIEKFVSVLELWEDILFGDATYALNNNKQVNLRKPGKLPLEADIEKLRNYVLSRMKTLTGSFHLFDSHSFVELRDCTCARLTLLNARRGGEPARLKLSDYAEAEIGSWIDQQRLLDLDPLDQLLVNSVKITYITGKGNNHLVPILIPEDTIAAVRKLADPETRKDVNVPEDNTYLFASTQGSVEHTSGWHAVHNVCDKLPLEKPKNMKATSNRHRVSTLFASLDLPKKDRKLFFKHMGHSEAINEDTYQVPPALLEITKVGKHLLQIDSGMYLLN